MALARTKRRSAKAADGERRVVIGLDQAQVDQVVRAASDGGAMSVLLGGGALRQRLTRELDGQLPAQMEDRRLSRSLMLGLLILACLPDDGSSLGIGELAKLTGMSKSTTHRYVTTLVAVGLAEREPQSRRYRLAGEQGVEDA